MNTGGIVVAYNFKEIEMDRKRTAAKVRDFLSDSFQTYLNKAGIHRTDLSSPKMDPSGVASHSGNSAEEGMQRIFDYELKSWVIYQTMLNCTENENLHAYHRTILIDKYVKLKEDWEIADEIGLSVSRCRDIKNNALCEFAERLEPMAIRNHVRFPRLIVYKSEGKEVKS